MTSAINESNKQISLNTAVNEDGSVSLKIGPRPKMTDRLPERLGVYTLSFLCIDSFFTLQLVDKRSREVAKKEIARFGNWIELESVDCSRLLTGVWNMTLAHVQNPREALTSITRVAMQSGVLVLKTPVEDYGWRYVDPEQLSLLQEKLKTSSWINKLALIKTLMQQAIAFPPHLNVTHTIHSTFHGMPVHECYAGKLTILEGETFYKIERVLNLKKSPDRTSFIFQMIPISLSLEEYPFENIKTMAELDEEINAGIDVAKETMLNLSKTVDFSKDGVLVFSRATNFEVLAKEAVMRAFLIEIGSKPKYTRLSLSLGGQRIDHTQPSSEQTE